MDFVQRLFRSFGLIKKSVNIIILGLDNSGKSSILSRLQTATTIKTSSEVETLEVSLPETTPTIGFQIDSLNTSKLKISVFDMSGAKKYRELWYHYYSEIHGIVFVLDTFDQERMEEARQVFWGMFEHEELKHKKMPILIMANKLDLEGGLTASQCSDRLQLENIKDRPWNINACSAKTGEGIQEAFEWLYSHLE